MRVAVIGGGGHGHDLAAIAKACGHTVGFLDDDPDRGEGPAEYVGLGPVPYVVGVNDPATRRRLATGSNPVALVHPSATVAPTATLSPGCVVGAGAHLGPDTILGVHVHIGAGCTLTRTTVGAFTTIAPGVDIAGDVTIGEGCLIGVGVTVSNLVTIGDNVTVGAGAVVVRDVAPGETVVTRDLTATGSQR